MENIETTLAGLAPEAPLTTAQAVALFDHLADLPHIAHGFANEGCYARAHLMCREAERLGRAPEKAWAFEGEGTLTVLAADGRLLNWWYHVALALPVQLADGQVEKMVFDPSLFDGPVPVERWADMMDAEPGKVSVVPFGQGPNGSDRDYKPADARYKIAGTATGPDSDDDAMQVMDKHLQVLSYQPDRQRIVYSSDLRADETAKAPAPLAREGATWISLSLHQEREREARIQETPPFSSFQRPRGKGYHA